MAKLEELNFLSSPLGPNLDPDKQKIVTSLHQPIISKRTEQQAKSFADRRSRFWVDLQKAGQELGLKDAAFILSRSPILQGPPPPPPPDDGGGARPVRDLCSRPTFVQPFSFGFPPEPEMILKATDPNTGGESRFARKIALAKPNIGGFSLLSVIGTLPKAQFEADENNGTVSSASATIYQLITVPFTNVPVQVEFDADFSIPLDPRICLLHPDENQGLIGLVAQQSLVEFEVFNFEGLSKVLDQHVFVDGLSLRINPNDEFHFLGELTPDSFIHFFFSLHGSLVIDSSTNRSMIAAFTCKTFNMLGGPVAASKAWSSGDFRDASTISEYLNFGFSEPPGPVFLRRLSVTMCPPIAFPSDPSL